MTRVLINQDYLDVYKEDISLWAETFNCSECNALLGLGDEADGQWPYNSEYNRCKKCKEDKR